MVAASVCCTLNHNAIYTIQSAGVQRCSCVCMCAVPSYGSFFLVFFFNVIIFYRSFVNSRETPSDADTHVAHVITGLLV